MWKDLQCNYVNRKALQKHLQKSEKTQKKIGCEKHLTQNCSRSLRNVITFASRKGDRAQFMIAYLQDDLYRKKRLNYVLRRFRISGAVLQSLLGRMPVSQTSLFLSFLFFFLLIDAASLLLWAAFPIPCLSVSFSAHFLLGKNSDELDKIACQDR